MSRLCIVGMGLIGGSLAAALKRKGCRFDGQITGVVRSAANGERALELGLVDDISLDLVSAAAQADIILLAVPMLSMQAQLKLIAPVLRPETIITDAGSVKGAFIEDARSVFPLMNRVVPGHPIAGGERSGVEASNPELYINRRVLLTPLAETDEDAVEAVERLWQYTGAVTERLSAEHHDRVLAATSHLPHVLAFALVDTLARQQEAEEIFRYAAGGFKDFTRIASSDAIMWRDICLSNREAVLDAMDAFSGHLADLRVAIEQRDGTQIETIFRRARAARDEHA